GGIVLMGAWQERVEMAFLATVDLVKNYGRVPAVRGVSLTVDDRELLCILGPSGCGKSTTLRVIGGFEQADGGDVRLDGVSIAALPPTGDRRRWFSSAIRSGRTCVSSTTSRSACVCAIWAKRP